MALNFIGRFKAWWRAPVTRQDKIRGVIVGLMGGFWIGALGRLFFTSSLAPVEITVLALWGIGVALLAGALGYVFPKAVTCALFPFAISGIGSS